MGETNCIRDNRQHMPPNTEVRVVSDGLYHGHVGVVIKSDPRVELVCVDLYKLVYPVWFRKDELDVIGFVRPDIINRHIWQELLET